MLWTQEHVFHRKMIAKRGEKYMGRFVNPDNSAFQVALNSKIHIDVQWLKKIGWLNTNDTELNRARQDVEALKQLKTEIENLIKNIK